MSGCSILSQFHQGFMSGAGFGLGIGLSNFVNDIFRFNVRNFSCFGFGYGCGFGFYGYPTPQIPMPNPYQSLANYSYINNTQSIWGSNNTSIPDFSRTEVRGNSYENVWSNFSVSSNQRYDYFVGTTSVSSNRTTVKKTRPTVTLENYNSQKGEKLAKDIVKFKEPNSTSTCAGYVSNALERTGLSNGLRGDCEYMLGYLQQNSNFKEISMEGIDYNNLPAGCILIYDPGSQGYSQKHGHIQITTGHGSAVSDFETYNIRKPDHIFIPV